MVNEVIWAGQYTSAWEIRRLQMGASESDCRHLALCLCHNLCVCWDARVALVFVIKNSCLLNFVLMSLRCENTLIVPTNGKFDAPVSLESATPYMQPASDPGEKVGLDLGLLLIEVSFCFAHVRTCTAPQRHAVHAHCLCPSAFCFTNEAALASGVVH
eukprot:1681714-Amphidinium_carterae.1